MTLYSYVRGKIGVFAVCLLAGFAGACGDDTNTTRLVLTGSSTVAPLASEIAKRFESKHPGVRIDVQAGGSSRGIVDARNGVAHIGMASRGLKPQESDLCGIAIARDGIAIIVHKDNPVRTLSDDQVERIFRGIVTNWRDVGGDDAPISVINKADGRSTLELFLKYYKLKPEEVRASVIIGDNEQGIKTLAGNPDAIGYVSIGAAEFNVSANVPIRILPTNGVAATTENVRNNSFPLARPLTLVTKNKPKGLVKTFIDFARSAEVHDLVRQLYFVPLRK